MLDFAPKSSIDLAPKSNKKMTYNEALLYCQFLEYNDHQDWRLPTEDEYWHYIIFNFRDDGWHKVRQMDFKLKLYVYPVRDVC